MPNSNNPEPVPRIEVRGMQYGRFLVDLAWNLFGASPTDASGPRVVAIDRDGNERVVEECASKRQAMHAAEKIRAEIEDVGARTWAIDRNLPGSFW